MEQIQVSLKARIANILEVSSTVVPVLVLILGIGMMRFMPASPAMPVFNTDEEAQAFFNDYNLIVKPGVPLLLSTNTCKGCAEFRQALLNERIVFAEQNADQHPGAGLLLTRVRKLTADPTVPKIIIGRKVVAPNVAAVKLALQRLSPER
jgi:hypothetical protein